MDWLFGFVIVVILIFLYVNYSRKKCRENLRRRLQEEWGKPKESRYVNFKVVARYFENQKRQQQAFHTISDQTAKDLDLESLFLFLDRTTSKVGQQFLYKRLRTVLKPDTKESFFLEDKVKIFLENEEIRLSVQEQLSRLASTDAYDLEILTREYFPQSQKYEKLLYLLLGLVVLSILAGIFNPFFFVFLVPLFLVNAIFHYINKARLNYYLSGIKQLFIAYDVGCKVAEKDEFSSTEASCFLKEIKKIKTKIAFISLEKQLNTEIAQIGWLFMELVKILFSFEVLLFYSLEKDLLKKQQNILSLFNFIGEMDTAITIASVRDSSLETCSPKFWDKKELVIEKIQHPLVESCVTNNLELKAESLLLTGANMSGKTTFIKTVALNSLLAQTLGFCFAKEYQAPFMKIETSIKVTDDLLTDTSYYLQEVLNVKEFIEASRQGNFSLFVLDELFKGTNTIERIAAGKAVLSYLNNENSIVLVSTHDIELAELLQQEGYQIHCFDESIVNEKIHFSYKLKDGVPKHKNAIKILELYQYPLDIVQDAEALSKNNFVF